MQQDVIIIGAGPAGLSLAVAVANAGLTVTVVERLARDILAHPTVDGRDIALTHRSVEILRTLGIWERFPPNDVAPIREARVLDGTSSGYLGFDTRRSKHAELGYLVSNHVIRETAFHVAAQHPAITILCEAGVDAITIGEDAAQVRLADGRLLTAPLLVAADSRFSETRRRLGIGAELRDFGRVVIVCRVAHAQPHHGVAYECFHYGGTLAMLPLNGNTASAVVTISTDQSEALMAMPSERFADWVRDRFNCRLGDMTLVGERHLYPLVAVYAHRFTARRLALIGDAAVGMHPVTAHGYNFGLYGIDALTRQLTKAVASGRDIGAAEGLSRYAAEHRRATLPIYLGTNALVGLFTDDRRPARLLRRTVLQIARRLPPLKWGITRQLTGTRI